MLHMLYLSTLLGLCVASKRLATPNFEQSRHTRSQQAFVKAGLLFVQRSVYALLAVHSSYSSGIASKCSEGGLCLMVCR